MAALRSLTLAALLAGVGCAPPAVRGGIALVDDAADTVHLPRPAARVVSLIPATTELLFAIGAGSDLVGRTRYDEWPPEAASIPDVGDGLEPNVEAVLARRPDLVILYRGAGTAAAASRLRSFGIPALLLRTDRLADVPRLARLLGIATGHERGADSVAVRFGRELDSVSIPPGLPPSERPSVLLLAWQDPPLTIGAGSFLDELLERAGGRNLFHDLSLASGPVSLEAIAQRNPDVILTFGSDSLRLAGRPEWRVVSAVRLGHFIRVKGSEFSQPSPRSPQAIGELRAALQRWERRR